MGQLEMDTRIVIEYDDVRRAVESVLEEIGELRSDSFLRRILSAEDKEEIRKWEERSKRRMEDPFSLVIMGDFKRGKSTLLNALIGRGVATVNATPETVTINRISYGTSPRREAVLTNGMRIKLEESELQRKNLEEILEKLPAPVDYIDIHDDAEILRDIAIVDTPGMGDMLGKYDQQVIDYLARADAVIYVVSALSPFSETEQAFLAASLVPQSFSRLFVVVNMADCLDEVEDVDRITKLVKEQAVAIMPEAAVFAVSALDEFCRKTGQGRPDSDFREMLEESFHSFEDALRDDMLMNRDVIKSERMLYMADSMLKDVEKRIRVTGTLLGSQKEDLKQMEQDCHENLANINTRLDKSRKELDRFYGDLSTEAQVWESEFMQQLKLELDKARSQPTNILQKHLQFYLMDMAKRSVTACLRAHQGKMDEKLKTLSLELAQGEGQLEAVTAAEPSLAVQLADISWTGADTAAFYVSTGAQLLLGSEGVGVLVSTLSDLVGGVVRHNKMKNRQQDIIEPLLQQYPGIEQQVINQVGKAYQKSAEMAGRRLEEAFTRQMNTSVSALQHAQRVLEAEDIKETELREHLDLAYEIIERCAGRLRVFTVQ
ncbi:MAG: dynamin family protein [Bacillota bacterium]|nr:dynamin family protein [Bacillota bacterium]